MLSFMLTEPALLGVYVFHRRKRVKEVLQTKTWSLFKLSITERWETKLLIILTIMFSVIVAYEYLLLADYTKVLTVMVICVPSAYVLLILAEILSKMSTQSSKK